MSDTPQIPAGGGSFRRDKNGNLTLIEAPTAPVSDKIPGSDPIFPDSAVETPPAPPSTPVDPPKNTGKEG